MVVAVKKYYQQNLNCIETQFSQNVVYNNNQYSNHISFFKIEKTTYA